jgi:hypothetical protein
LDAVLSQSKTSAIGAAIVRWTVMVGMRAV